jgi:DNA-binding XRE family transcriptional regulator
MLVRRHRPYVARDQPQVADEVTVYRATINNTEATTQRENSEKCWGLFA